MLNRLPMQSPSLKPLREVSLGLGKSPFARSVQTHEFGAHIVRNQIIDLAFVDGLAGMVLLGRNPHLAGIFAFPNFLESERLIVYLNGVAM